MPKYKMISTAVALTLASSLASAAIVSTLNLITPTGTVGPADTIDVWVRLTLDPSSDPLAFDPSQADGNLPLSFLPTHALQWNPSTWSREPVPFASYESVGSTFSYRCTQSNMVMANCDNGEYTVDASYKNENSWLVADLNLQPGESLDILMFQLVPTDGSVTPGEYFFGGIELGFWVNGKDSRGIWMGEFAWLGNTCPAGESSCLFTRTVSEVPLPAGVWLFGSALMGLAGARYRRVTGA